MRDAARPSGPARLYWAWAIATAVSILGATFSYLRDWPMGATIVCLFGVTVGLISLSVRMKYVDEKADRLEGKEFQVAD